MYKNLEVELVRKGMSKSALAKRLGIAPQTLSNKLSGRCKITLPEAIKIRQEIESGLSLEELFETA